MKAARVLQFGPPNVIMIDDLPRPEPGAAQLLVGVMAAGVGNWDALVRGGKIPNEHLPLVLGYEQSGIVEATGAGVYGFRLARAHVHNLMLISTYRDKEVYPAHPLTLKLGARCAISSDK